MHSEMNSDSLVKIDGVFGYFFLWNLACQFFYIDKLIELINLN